jgi:hypothetical protein
MWADNIDGTVNCLILSFYGFYFLRRVLIFETAFKSPDQIDQVTDEKRTLFIGMALGFVLLDLTQGVITVIGGWNSTVTLISNIFGCATYFANATVLLVMLFKLKTLATMLVIN